MSDSVTRDIMTLISELGYGTIGKSVYDQQLLSKRKPVHGILVEQRTTAPTPDVLLGDDTSYLTVQVRGEGQGEAGKKAAYTRTMALYRDLRLILDREIDGTFYELITPDSSPYEVRSGDNSDFAFGLQVVRHYTEDSP